MSMYGVNGSVPKTLVKYLVKWVAENDMDEASRMTLLDIVDTPISPELIPADENGNIKQITEDLVGPYELHDFFLYYFLRCGFRPSKIFFLAVRTFKDVYDEETIKKWLQTFFRRFFNQQFKSLHRIEFQRKSGDIKKEMFEWNKIRGSRRRMLKIAICDDEQPIREYLKRLVKKCTGGGKIIKYDISLSE